MPAFEHDGLSIEYSIAGDPQTPAVVLLHDAGEDGRSWFPHALALSRDFCVVAPDLRGHGKSGAPPEPSGYSMDAFTGDLRALVDHLGLELAAFCGAGLGALVALQFATEHPARVAGLVLCDVTPAPDNPAYDAPLREYEKAVQAFAAEAQRRGMHALARDASVGIGDRFLAQGIRAQYLRISPEALAGAAAARLSRPDLVPLLGPRLASTPVMLCYGALGPFGTAAAVITRELPAARVVTFRDVVLAPHMAAPDAFSEQLGAFFDALESGGVVAGPVTV